MECLRTGHPVADQIYPVFQPTASWTGAVLAQMSQDEFLTQMTSRKKLAEVTEYHIPLLEHFFFLSL